MLHDKASINDHEKKINTLKHDPEYIRRYRNRSFEMIATSIEGNIHLAGELLANHDTPADFSMSLLKGLMNITEHHSFHEICRRVSTLLGEYTLTSSEQDYLLDNADNLNSFSSLIQHCTMNEELAIRCAEEIPYTPIESLSAYPNALFLAFRKHGFYLFQRYLQEDIVPLSETYLKPAIESEWCNTQNRSIKDLDIVIKKTHNQPSLRTLLIKHGLIHHLEGEFTPQERLLAASHPSFFSGKLMSYSNKVHPMQTLWDKELLLHYVQAVPNALEEIHASYRWHGLDNVTSYLQLTNEEYRDVLQKAVIACPKNLLHIEEDNVQLIKVSAELVDQLLAADPKSVWDVHSEWVTDSHRTKSLLLCDTLPNISGKLSREMIDTIIEKDWYPPSDSRTQTSAFFDNIDDMQLDRLAIKNPNKVSMFPRRFINQTRALIALNKGHFDVLEKIKLDLLPLIHASQHESLAVYLTSEVTRYWFSEAVLTENTIKVLASLASKNEALKLSLLRKLPDTELIVFCQHLPTVKLAA